MKTFKDYSEDIYKCSKCGLCQAVCPIYEHTGLETAVTRGKFTLLNAVVNGEIKNGKNLSKYLDLCLGCKACYDFCPSGISAEEVIIAARQFNVEQNGISFLKKFILSNFDSKIRLNILKIFLKLYRNIGLIKLSKLVSVLIKPLKNPIAIFNMQVQKNVRYKKLESARPKSRLKIVYFPGCISNYVNSGAKDAIRVVLERNGFQVDVLKNMSCCGIPARSAGDIKTFIKLAKKNVENIDPDIDYLITDCASCGSIWKMYPEVLEGELKEKAELIARKAININKFLASFILYVPEDIMTDKTVTYHDPCHLKRFQNVHEEPRKILKMIPGLRFVEMAEADKCCGAAGTFCVTNPEISLAISEKKAENILNTGADIVSTSCSGCNIGIAQGLTQLGAKMPLYQPVELLAELYMAELKRTK